MENPFDYPDYEYHYGMDHRDMTPTVWEGTIDIETAMAFARPTRDYAGNPLNNGRVEIYFPHKDLVYILVRKIKKIAKGNKNFWRPRFDPGRPDFQHRI